MSTRMDDVKSRPFAVEQNRVDVTWERAQEQAMHAFKVRNADGARTGWAKALDIAERHFERGDPRLASSLSNHAFSLLRQGQDHQANMYFQRALIAWEESWRWIPWMTPSSSVDESEAAPYDQGTQDAFYALVKQGKTITERTFRERQLPDVDNDDWSAVKPKSMNDVRRLFSAIFLMPTASSR